MQQTIYAITVHYNPRNPYYAVLKAGVEKSGWAALAIFLLLCLGSGIWVVIVWPGLDHNRLTMTWEMIKKIIGL